MSEDGRSEADLKSIVAGTTYTVGAFSKAAGVIAKTAPLALPFTVITAFVGAYVGRLLVDNAESFYELPPETVGLLTQIGFGLLTLSGIYAGIQFAKRETASRASWIPALAIVPSFALGVTFYVISGDPMRQQLMIAENLPLMGWTVLYTSLVGAAVAIVQIRTAHGALTGSPVPAGEVLSEVGSRTLDVTAPHAGKVHAVFIGMQVLIPGVFYALRYAFVDMVAVIRPEDAALRRSSLLTMGMRPRLFRLLLAWFLVSFVGDVGISLAMGATTSEVITGYAMASTVASAGIWYAQAVWWSLTSWVCQIAVLVLYLEREEQVKAKAELRRLAKARAAE